MKAIYDAHVEAMGAGDPQAQREALGRRALGSGEAPLHGYTREAYHELETTFPRLPSPTLVMYVFPHLASEERVPVPGYVTTFPMYERVAAGPADGKGPPHRHVAATTSRAARSLTGARPMPPAQGPSP